MPHVDDGDLTVDAQAINIDINTPTSTQTAT
jgi:hypothetical protein